MIATRTRRKRSGDGVPGQVLPRLGDAGALGVVVEGEVAQDVLAAVLECLEQHRLVGVTEAVRGDLQPAAALVQHQRDEACAELAREAVLARDALAVRVRLEVVQREPSGVDTDDHRALGAGLVVLGHHAAAAAL
jgi:hypothetical protein